MKKKSPGMGGLLERSAAYRDLSREFFYPADDKLRSEHHRIFGHALSPDCPPYETHYGTGHVFQQAHVLADIAGFYRAFGLEVNSLRRDRADHLSTELEFMAYLVVKEAHALEAGRPEKADLCRDAQRKFFETHLGRWAQAFARRLAQKSSDHYGRLARRLDDFIRMECEILDVKPEKSARLGFAPPEAQDSCFACQAEGPSLSRRKQ